MLRHLSVCLVATIAIVLIIALCVSAWLFLPRGQLPSRYTTVLLNPEVLKQLILHETPIGADQSDVENSLRNSFHVNWKVNKHQAPQLISHLGFSNQVDDGDYYITSDFAVVGYVVGADIATAFFLFNRSGKLKDVAVRMWNDCL